MKFYRAVALCPMLIACSGSDEAISSAQQAIVNVLPEFPYTVLPMKFVSTSNANCLTAKFGSPSVGATITTEACDSAQKSQDWFLVLLNDNSYQIRTGHVGLLMSMRGASTIVGESAQVDEVQPAAHARWEILQPAAGQYQLKNANSGLCLNSVGVQVTCSNATARYNIQPKYAFPYSVMAKHSEKCLNVAGGSSANNANVQQYPCVGASNERWYLSPVPFSSPQSYYIKSLNSGKCLDIAGGSLANNGNAQQYDCVGVANERWTISPAGEGFFYLQNVNSGKCLTVAGASTATQANVDQYTCVAQDNQKWRWEYFIEKHVEWVLAKNGAGQGTTMTSADWDLNFQTARSVFLSHGISLVHDSSADRATLNNEALHHLGLDNTPASCPPFGNKTPLECADALVGNWPGKIVLYATFPGSGFTSGNAKWAKIAGNGYSDQCAVDQCGPAGDNDNRHHIGHELGHYFGNVHTFADGNDDWLADTDPDFQTDACLGQTSTPPAASGNIMSYYVGCNMKLSPQQGGIARATAYARYSTGTN